MTPPLGSIDRSIQLLSPTEEASAAFALLQLLTLRIKPQGTFADIQPRVYQAKSSMPEEPQNSQHESDVPSWVQQADETNAADHRDQPWKDVIDKLEKERDEGRGVDGNREGDYIDLKLKNAIQCGCECC